VTQDLRARVRSDVGRKDVSEDRGPAPEDGCKRGQKEPDDPEDAEMRKRDEDRVEPAHTVVDNPALKPPVEDD